MREVLRSKTDEELIYDLPLAPADMQAKICGELGRRKAVSARSVILSLLERAKLQRDDSVMEAAAEALGQLAATEAGPILTTMLQDKTLSEGIRDTAAYAIGLLNYTPAKAALVDALSDASKSVRLCAVGALDVVAEPSTAARLRSYGRLEADDEIRSAISRLIERLEAHLVPRWGADFFPTMASAAAGAVGQGRAVLRNVPTNTDTLWIAQTSWSTAVAKATKGDAVNRELIESVGV